MEYFLDLDKIETFIKNRGWSKLEFCKVCGIPPSVYYKLGHKNLTMTNDMLLSIAKVMGVSVVEIIKIKK